MTQAEQPFPLAAEQICTFIRETTKLDPHSKPGQQLAHLVQSLFDVESVAIFDADLQEVYQVGEWSVDLQDALQNICIFETVSDDAETGLSRRVVQMGNLPIGAMLLRGETRGRVASTIASIIAITFDRYHAFANESRTESARQTEQLRTTVLDSLAHAYKTPLTAIAAASEGLSAMGNLSPRAKRPRGLDRRTDVAAEPPDDASAQDRPSTSLGHDPARREDNRRSAD